MENPNYHCLISRLAARLRVSITTARVIAELAGIGQAVRS